MYRRYRSNFQAKPEERKELALVWELAREKCMEYAQLLKALEAANLAEEKAKEDYEESVSLFGEAESLLSSHYLESARLEHKVLFWKSVLCKRELENMKWKVWSEEEFLLDQTKKDCRIYGNQIGRAHV